MANEAQISRAPWALTKPRWSVVAGIGAALLALLTSSVTILLARHLPAGLV